jgi:hypothetical protein
VIDDLFIYWGWGSQQKLKRFDFLFHVFMQLCAWSCTLCHTSNGLTVCSDATLLSIMWLVSIPKLVNMKEKSYLVICKPHYKTLWVFSHKSQGSWQCEITIVVSSIKCTIWKWQFSHTHTAHGSHRSVTHEITAMSPWVAKQCLCQ